MRWASLTLATMLAACSSTGGDADTGASPMGDTSFDGEERSACESAVRIAPCGSLSTTMAECIGQFDDLRTHAAAHCMAQYSAYLQCIAGLASCPADGPCTTEHTALGTCLAGP